jgi:hypothetical protein
MRHGIVLLLTAALGACVPPAPRYEIDPARSGPFPDDYKQIVAAYVRDTFLDPHTLQDVAISAPDRGRMADQQGWIVCFVANGKNGQGAYAGRRTTAYLINDGRVIAAEQDPAACEYEKPVPWRELDIRPQ